MMMTNKDIEKMKQIIYRYLTDEITRESAINELREIGFTQFEAIFELNSWELN